MGEGVMGMDGVEVLLYVHRNRRFIRDGHYGGYCLLYLSLHCHHQWGKRETIIPIATMSPPVGEEGDYYTYRYTVTTSGGRGRLLYLSLHCHHQWGKRETIIPIATLSPPE